MPPLNDPPVPCMQDCLIEHSLLMGADFYEQFDECEIYADCLPIGVGRGTHVSLGQGPLSGFWILLVLGSYLAGCE